MIPENMRAAFENLLVNGFNVAPFTEKVPADYLPTSPNFPEREASVREVLRALIYYKRQELEALEGDMAASSDTPEGYTADEVKVVISLFKTGESSVRMMLLEALRRTGFDIKALIS